MRYRYLFLVLVFLVAGGCASSGKHLPDHAMKDPARGVSIEAPAQIEKNGVKRITTFTAKMDPALWTEVIAGSGVWPALARTPQGELKKGYAYLSEVNYWGDFLLRFIFAGEEGLSPKSRILYFNRGAGWAYTLKGEEVRGEEIEYDPEKFDDNKEYQRKLFAEFGMTLKELDEFWFSYSRERGISLSSTSSSVQHIKVGDNGDWKNFREEITSRMQHKYKMGDEELRLSYLPKDQFKHVASSIPGFSGSGRFVKNARIPLVALPFTGIGMAAASGASVASSAVTASIDDDWSGFYGRAEVLRYKLAPNFRVLCQIYKNLLRQRDKRIRELERQQNQEKISF